MIYWFGFFYLCNLFAYIFGMNYLYIEKLLIIFLFDARDNFSSLMRRF